MTIEEKIRRTVLETASKLQYVKGADLEAALRRDLTPLLVGIVKGMGPHVEYRVEPLQDQADADANRVRVNITVHALTPFGERIVEDMKKRLEAEGLAHEVKP